MLCIGMPASSVRFYLQGELLDAVEWKHFARSLAQFCEVEADAIEKDLYWRALHMVLIVGRSALPCAFLPKLNF